MQDKQIQLRISQHRIKKQELLSESFSLSDLGHEILPELSQEKTRQKRLQMQIQILTKGTEAF